MEIQIKNGSTWFDFTPFIRQDGFQETKYERSGSNAGYNILGTEIRDRVAVKYKISVKCRPILKTDLNTIRTLTDPETFQIRYRDNGVDDWTYRNVCTDSQPCTYMVKHGTKEYYNGFDFEMREL